MVSDETLKKEGRIPSFLFSMMAQGVMIFVGWG